jgi:hypothetical protein
MSRWQRRVDDLLYEGESVRETIDIDTARVVVTSHRVLAFTPEMDGENFTQADRPNVAGIGTGAEANADLLERGVRYGIVGAVLVATGLIVDFGSILGDVEFDAGAAQEVGAGGLIGLTQTLLDIMTQLDFLLRVFGGLAIFLAVVLLGVYWFERDPTLVIGLAGDDSDIHLPRPDDVESARSRLESAVFPDAEGEPVEPESSDGLGSRFR